MYVFFFGSRKMGKVRYWGLNLFVGEYNTGTILGMMSKYTEESLGVQTPYL